MRDLSPGHVREDWGAQLDLATLARVSGSYVSEDGDQRHGLQRTESVEDAAAVMVRAWELLAESRYAGVHRSVQNWMRMSLHQRKALPNMG